MSRKTKTLIVRSRAIFTGEDTSSDLLDGYFKIEDGLISAVEGGEVPPEEASEATIKNVGEQMVLPGFVDPHTHLVHGGSREQELDLKLAGKSYMEIHEVGGILSTVRSTRALTSAELYDKASASLDRMLTFGTTTAEAKSGYGLDLETEIRCLEVAEELNRRHPVDIVSTYMGAHALPPEFADDISGYVDFMLERVMPLIKERQLAEFCDIFCEEGIFDLEISRHYLRQARAMGFDLKVHADEIVPLGGAELAAELGAISAEHLMAISDRGVERLAAAGTVAVLLPATTFFLMAEKYAPARKMLNEGVKVALATDYNPGSSPTENIQTAMSHACFGMKMRPLEILRAVTLEAARAIRREDVVGSLRVGKKADFLITDVKSPAELIYRFGVNHVAEVYKEGKLVAERGRVCYD
ncbi:MAG TPA: imidazolonepropionase [Clostridiaceae bacterium]|nr:imidazolonepropionase [Clostridiaceae bacterium]